MRNYKSYKEFFSKKDHKEPLGKGKRICIVVSLFNKDITDDLLWGAKECLAQYGVDSADLDCVVVPGAFELPLAVQVAMKTRRYDAVVALGCVIRGETPHFNYICENAASGIMRTMEEHSIPVGFGLLTTENKKQALARSKKDKTNKGWEAAESALAMSYLLKEVIR